MKNSLLKIKEKIKKLDDESLSSNPMLYGCITTKDVLCLLEAIEAELRQMLQDSEKSPFIGCLPEAIIREVLGEEGGQK